MIGEVSALRQKQAAVEAELADKQERSWTRRRRRWKPKSATSKRCAPSCSARSACCASGWSRSTRRARPDMLNAILDSENWSEMAAADRIPEPDPELRRLGRRPGQEPARRGPRRGRAAGRAPRRRSKEARDAIAAKEREVAAARAEAEARFAELKAAQAERREAMEALEVARRGAQRQPRLDLRTDRRRRRRPRPTGQVPAPLNPGQEAQVITESEASAPASAPQAVAGRDLRRQLDRHHPLHLGRRPRLLRILRLRLLRRGQLRPARRRLPRKPARLDRPRDLGRTRAPASGSPSTPTPATPGWSSPASPSTPSAAPARAGTTPGSTRPKASSRGTRPVY